MKSMVQPPLPIKKFHWDPIAEPDAVNTIFDTRQPCDVEIGEMEVVFAANAPKEEKKVVEKPKIIIVLPDKKRQYNMNIALARFSKYTFQEVRDAVIDLNPALLAIDAIEQLINFAPLPEEIAAVRQFIEESGDLTKMDRPEQFVAAMTDIPLFKERLEGHKYAMNFEQNYDSCMLPLTSVYNASKACQESEKFKDVLKVVLKIGNKMNAAEAGGFKMSTLPKMHDVRSATKPVRTLEQYVVDIIFEQKPELLNFYGEVKPADDAMKVDLAGIEGEVAALRAGLTKTKETIAKAEKMNEQSGVMGDMDPSAGILKDFVLEVEPKVDDLEKFVVAVKKKFKECGLFLGETEKSMNSYTPKTYFSIISKYAKNVESMRRAKQDAVDRDLRRMAKAEAAAFNAKGSATKPVVKKALDNAKVVTKEVKVVRPK